MCDVFGCKHDTVHMWSSENSLLKLVLPMRVLGMELGSSVLTVSTFTR